MEEIWKDIYFLDNGKEYDFVGYYQISNYGRVRSLDRIFIKNCKNRFEKGKIFNFNNNKHKNKKGYIRIKLNNGLERINYNVHRLVANMFIPNPDNLPEVNHIDENKSNNRVDNLEWVTSKQNCNHGTRNQRISNSRKGSTKKMPVNRLINGQ